MLADDTSIQLISDLRLWLFVKVFKCFPVGIHYKGKLISIITYL